MVRKTSSSCEGGSLGGKERGRVVLTVAGEFAICVGTIDHWVGQATLLI